MIASTKRFVMQSLDINDVQSFQKDTCSKVGIYQLLVLYQEFTMKTK